MIINHNIAALNTYRMLSANNTAASKSLEKLSSGLRINRAGDDAAGLAISEKMRGQIRGLNQAIRNAQDGISLIQTAEGALNETHAILQRMRELAVQAANDTNTTEDRIELQKEVDQLAQELTRIANDTEFNTQKLLNGTFKGTFHIGANKGQNIVLTIARMDAQALNVAGAAGAQFTVTSTQGPTTEGNRLAGNSTFDVIELDEGSTVGKATGGELAVKYALRDENGKIVAVSVDGKQYDTIKAQVDLANLSSAVLNKDDGTEAYKFADPVISGQVKSNAAGDELTATATVSTELANGTYTVVGSEHYLVTGSYNYGLINEEGQLVAVSADGQKWYDVADVADENKTVMETVTAIQTRGTQIVVGHDGGLNISTQASADAAITTIQKAIEFVSGERSKLGAYQNRLEHTINNLGTSAENLTAAESRIRDVDMAKEMMEFTKMSILSQAAQAMLAQANQMPQGVLQLLR